MNEQEVMNDVVSILKPFVKAPDALAGVSLQTSILKDLKVNSARLVDVVLEIEDKFGITVSDEDADKVKTVGDAGRAYPRGEGLSTGGPVKLVGNDVVDLGDPSIRASHLSARFVARVCTDVERAALAEAADPKTLLWSFFAAKEAATRPLSSCVVVRPCSPSLDST